MLEIGKSNSVLLIPDAEFYHTIRRNTNTVVEAVEETSAQREVNGGDLCFNRPIAVSGSITRSLPRFETFAQKSRS